VEIIVDTREQQPWHFQSFANVVTISQKLDTGDYTLKGFEDVLCIERKMSVPELAKNIIEKRFTKELERMSDFHHSFLILEFDYKHIDNFPNGCGLPQKVKSKIRITPQFIMKRLAEIQVNYDVHILPCSHKLYAENVAMNIMKRVREKY